MRTYNQQELDNLIKCRKLISRPPQKKMVLEGGHRRNDMELTSEDGQLRFTCFMRINEDFNENFTIGLEYHPKEERGSICLLRYNGPHGDFNKTQSPGPHFQYHIHEAKSEYIEAGLRAESYGQVTDAYASYQEALGYFLRFINVTNAHLYPDLLQMQLDFDTQETKS